MLILVGVTINFALNGGLINKAKQAAKQTQIEADRESLLSCVIASMGLDGKVDFEELDQEVLKIGFTGSNGTYTSPSGNVFTVNEDGNIVSEGESSGDSGSSSTDADLAYLKTYIGTDFLDMMDENSSGLLFKDPNIVTDFIASAAIGSIDESASSIAVPMFYKGKAYTFLININNDTYTVANVTENSANNTNPDFIYLRTLIGKYASEFATVDIANNQITFNDSNITLSPSFDGNITIDENLGVVVPIVYKGNDYTMFLMPLNEETQLCIGVIEGEYEPEETPTATD